MDIILVFGWNCWKWLIFHFLYRLSLLNFDLNGAAELPAGRGPTGEEGQARREEGPFGGKSTPCWRGPTVDQGVAGGAAPTWAGGERDSRRPVGVARRWIKALPAGRRQHGLAASGIRGALLAWPGGGLRLCRRGGANMGRRRVRFGGALLAWPEGGIRLCRRGGANMGRRRAG